jgi:MFS family permease
VSVAVTRRRLQTSLVLGVGLGSTGYIAAITISTIVAQQLSGGSSFAGLPGATIVLGSAAASQLLSRFMVAYGRRAGLVLGYGIGAAGALTAGIAVVLTSFPLFLVATAAMGCANAANQLSRYTAPLLGNGTYGLVLCIGNHKIPGLPVAIDFGNNFLHACPLIGTLF